MDNEINLADVDVIVDGIGTSTRHVIHILQALQERYNYLPEEALRRVCETTDITPASVTGVASFYSQFRHKPAGQHFVRVCIGTACHVKGSPKITEALRRYLKIDDDEDTDSDGLFTIEEVACLGCCMLAPAVQIDDVIYGFVEPQNVGSVLKDFISSQAAVSGKSVSKDAGAGVHAEIRMCLCSSCAASGALAVAEELNELISELSLSAQVRTVGCTGVSYQTPLIEIALDDGRSFRYGMVKPEDIRRILLRHLRPSGLSGRVRAAATGLLEQLLIDRPHEPVIRYAVDFRAGGEADYVGCQNRLATEHAGSLDPLNIEDYITHDGCSAFRRCLDDLPPEQVLAMITDSGLRGRGGAGFPTGRKWDMVRNAPGKTRYIICNGDEGDPGAFMDRMILESFPFRVLEGMLIAARTVDAEKGFLYVRAEYPLAIHRMEQAIALFRERGLLGSDIRDSGMSFEIELVPGAGAFVCGEETALIAAIEGRRGMPRYRPPFPAHSGVFGSPTLVNNVETYALVPWIIRNGAESFRKIGTDSSRGTKSFALAGKIVRGGLIEVPMGITIRQIIEEIGGGIQEEHQLKGVQIGGPSGGCIPASMADTPVDYSELVSLGAIMGSGGMVVLDETDCMVDIARYFLSFTQLQSCGKCTFCRIGTKRMLEILERICAGRGQDKDIDELEHMAAIIKQGSLCGLGRSAPNPVLSTIRYFREEYQAHIDGRCPAGKCRELIRYSINDKCIGCTRCAQRCPMDAIPMTPYQQHEIDSELCIRCDTCRQVCPSDAVEVT